MEQSKGRILYIEDDLASQRLVQRVLTSYGYEVFVAAEGLDGIALAREHKPNLILMDINLPTMDGQEITTRLRSLPSFSQIPIVALTANNSPGSREQALVAGCTGFLTKPINVVQFPGQIEEFLQGHREEMSEGERSEQLEMYARRLVDRLENKIHELQQANQRLRELDRIKSDFIVLVSHELRTPLTLISGYAFLLREQLGDSNDQQHPLRHIADGLSMGVERLSGVVEEIISVSRIAAGTLDLSLGPIRLYEVVERVVARALPTCRDRNLSLVIDDGLRALPIIHADGSQLRVALENVIGNAIKFTPDGGRIDVRGRVVGDAIDLAIQDTGIGIPIEEQRQIFEQFYRLGEIQHHSTSKSAFQGGGLGIGLAIARGIVEAHNGRIWVESEKRDPATLPGSTFHLLLPLRQQSY